jgi:nitrite reductase (NO-forming)
MQSELYTVGGYHALGLQGFDMTKGIDEKPTYVVFDGAEGSLVGPNALTAKTGESVRIYFGNAGPNLAANFHVIGEVFDHVYQEGGSKPQDNVQTTLVPAGGAAIVEFTVDVPGTYTLVDHALFRAFNKGAIGQLRVDGPSRNDLFSPKLKDIAYEGGALEAPPTKVEGDPVLEMGKATYERICLQCHQPTGLGVPSIFPPLAQSDYLAGASKEQLINQMFHGLQGPVTVLGQTYNGQMPALPLLSDEEIASVLTYVRASFGNKLGPITGTEVAAVRARLARTP